MAIETRNKWLIGANVRGLVMFKPPAPGVPFSRADALLLAAWLLAMAPMADPADPADCEAEFQRILAAVKNS